VTYLDDVQRLLDRLLGAEREAGIDLGRHTARHDLEDLAPELHEKVVERGVDLRVDARAVLLAVLDGLVDQGGVLGLLGRGQDQRRVCRRVLRLVLLDGGEVARVAHDGLRVSGMLWRECGIRTVPAAFNWSNELGILTDDGQAGGFGEWLIGSDQLIV
jgi:hypothetical protein